MKIKDFFSFSKNKVFWLNLIGMAIFVIIVIWGTLKGIDIYTRHGESKLVPNVHGMTSDKATETLISNKLRAAIIDSCYVADAQAGSVVDQKPAAGARVKEGRQIYLTICTNRTPMRTLPDIIDNSSVREAAARLIAAGFKLTEHVYIEGEKEWVYGVRYQDRELNVGAKAPIGSTLTLVVGSGDTLPSDSLSNSAAIGDDLHTIDAANSDSDNSWF